jgi:hypothetical protein
MKHILFSILLSVIILINGFSQKDSETRITKWDFSLGTGGIIGGPCKAMDEKLLKLGIGMAWDARTKYFPPVVFEVNRRINNYLKLGLNFSRFQQDLEWRNAPSETLYGFEIMALNPLISFNYKDFVYFGAGPTFNSIFYYQGNRSQYSGNGPHLGIGVTVKSFLEYPRKTRIHLRLEMQYSYGGEISDHYSDYIWPYPTRITNIPIRNLKVNYFYGGIGLGVRLFKRSE